MKFYGGENVDRLLKSKLSLKQKCALLELVVGLLGLGGSLLFVLYSGVFSIFGFLLFAFGLTGFFCAFFSDCPIFRLVSWVNSKRCVV